MSEQNIQNKIRLSVSQKTKTTLFRNNTGNVWTGVVKNTTDGGKYIQNPRPFIAGLCVGSSDLIGWTERVITSDMVGQKIAVFTALEVKDIKKSKTSPEQLNFIEKVKNSGGIAGVVKSSDEAILLVK